MFNDSNPAVQWSIVDYWRVPKRSYYAMQTAFSPQYLFSLFERDHYPVDQAITLPLYVVNDAHRPVPVQLKAVLHSPHDIVAQVERSLTLPPDSMAIEIDRLRLTPTVPGTYRLMLTLTAELGLLLENEYTITVVPAE